MPAGERGQKPCPGPACSFGANRLCTLKSACPLPDMESMSDGSQFLDIIFFAMVAVFLGLRLRSVLGRRSDSEPPPATAGFGGPAPPSPLVDGAPDNVVDMARRRRPADTGQP